MFVLYFVKTSSASEWHIAMTATFRSSGH